MTQEIKFSDEQDLADFIRRREDPVHIVGGGTRGLDLNYDRLDTSALCGVVEYEPGALTMVAKAGTPLSEIEATLAREGQQLAFEPIVLNSVLGTKGASTIGGVLHPTQVVHVGFRLGPRAIFYWACDISMDMATSSKTVAA